MNVSDDDMPDLVAGDPDMGERYEITFYSDEASGRLLYGRAIDAVEARRKAAAAENKGCQFVQIRDRTANSAIVGAAEGDR